MKKELVIENVIAICWIVPKKYLLLLDQTILLHFSSSIDRPLNLPQYPGSNNYFSIQEENTVKLVLRGHIWDKKKWSYKTGDLLKEVHFI